MSRSIFVVHCSRVKCIRELLHAVKIFWIWCFYPYFLEHMMQTACLIHLDNIINNTWRLGIYCFELTIKWNKKFKYLTIRWASPTATRRHLCLSAASTAIMILLTILNLPKPLNLHLETPTSAMHSILPPNQFNLQKKRKPTGSIRCSIHNNLKTQHHPIVHLPYLSSLPT